MRLQLHALAYNLANFLRNLATPEPIKDWSLTSLKENLFKIGAKIVSHGRYVAFQMADHQTTGGYPNIATVISTDQDALAQLRPRQGVIFRPVSVERAVQWARIRRKALAAYMERIRQCARILALPTPHLTSRRPE